MSGTKKVAALRPCAGKQASRHETACASSCGLDALMDHRMGVMSWLNAAPKPPTSKAAHRRPLRATNPFETSFFAYFFFCPFRPSEKNGKTPSKRLVAPRYRLLAGDLAATVCGASPPNKPLSWAIAFRSLGRRNLFGSPRSAKSAWARLFADGFGDAN
ncbi:Hypothetical protein W5S_1614 [Pectobacterium parmentieri]|uniref:Uncharacterized protein n=1 Tax=Pectobacterium parmentieri TaxID=1905730 RepID=A0A0H3I6Z8_PECPM|nr:Hypothetical protein W5S_1614 [Pectobacterium parmentieri]